MLPGLPFTLLCFSVFISNRQRRGEQSKISGCLLQPFPRQTERHKVDQGALATARIAQQHEMLMTVE